jgi:hypothetical protein
MSGSFEAVIVDADRMIEFDVTIHFESWHECDDTRYSVTGHEITGGRVKIPGEASCGVRPFVDCELNVDDLGSVGFAWFVKHYAAEIQDAISAHVAAEEFAGV